MAARVGTLTPQREGVAVPAETGGRVLHGQELRDAKTILTEDLHTTPQETRIDVWPDGHADIGRHP